MDKEHSFGRHGEVIIKSVDSIPKGAKLIDGVVYDSNGNTPINWQPGYEPPCDVCQGSGSGKTFIGSPAKCPYCNGKGTRIKPSFDD